MTELLPPRVTDADIASAFESKDFGRSDHKRELAMGVLKMALRYHCGHTLTQIMMSLELITKTGRVTEKGRRFCYETLNTDVSKLIEEAREEQQDEIDLKDACIKGMDEQMAMMSAEIDRLESPLNNVTCIVAEARSHWGGIDKFAGKHGPLDCLDEIAEALKAKESK